MSRWTARPGRARPTCWSRGQGPAGQVYELGGDRGFTLSELAAEVSAQTGRDVSYRDLPVAEYTQALIGAGLPEPAAEILADSDPFGHKRGLSQHVRDVPLDEMSLAAAEVFGGGR